MARGTSLRVDGFSENILDPRLNVKKCVSCIYIQKSHRKGSTHLLVLHEVRAPYMYKSEKSCILFKNSRGHPVSLVGGVVLRIFVCIEKSATEVL